MNSTPYSGAEDCVQIIKSSRNRRARDKMKSKDFQTSGSEVPKQESQSPVAGGKTDKRGKYPMIHGKVNELYLLHKKNPPPDAKPLAQKLS